MGRSTCQVSAAGSFQALFDFPLHWEKSAATVETEWGDIIATLVHCVYVYMNVCYMHMYIVFPHVCVCAYLYDFHLPSILSTATNCTSTTVTGRRFPCTSSCSRLIDPRKNSHGWRLSVRVCVCVWSAQTNTYTMFGPFHGRRGLHC